MMIFQTLKQIAVTTTVATVSSVVIAPTAWAATFYNISGTFNVGGTLNGSFSYDSVTKEYTDIDITTTSGGGLPGYTYQEASVGGADNGFFLFDVTFTSSLDIAFNLPGLAGEPPSIGLSTSTTENDGTERTITSGDVTAVPENFSPYSGVLVLALLGMRAAAVKSKKRTSAIK